MYKYVIRTVECFQGTRVFDFEKDALATAKMLHDLTGEHWYVTAIKVGK